MRPLICPVKEFELTWCWKQEERFWEFQAGEWKDEMGVLERTLETPGGRPREDSPSIYTQKIGKVEKFSIQTGRHADR